MSSPLIEHVAVAPDEKLRLFRAAARALLDEDLLLQRAMDDGAVNTGGYADVAHGLTYWLFETTLVYFVFRAWLPLVRVAWEHAVGDAANRPVAGLDNRRAPPEKCDLFVFTSDGTPDAAFEAKWWNTTASNDAVLSDIRKLRRNCPEVTKYLLTFWWGTDAKQDVSAAQQFCARHSLTLAYAASFGTMLWGQRAGYFAIGVIHVP